MLDCNVGARNVAARDSETKALDGAKRLLLLHGVTLQEGEQLCVPLLDATVMAERVGRHYLLLAEWRQPEATLLDMLESVASMGDPCLQLVVHRGTTYLGSIRAALDANDVDRFHEIVNG